MATLWSVFTQRILNDVPRLPRVVVDDRVRDAAIDFCRRSRVYVIDHPAISSTGGVGTYAWAPGSDLKVVRAEEVWYNKKKLDPVVPSDLSTMYDYWPDETSDDVKYYLQQAEETITLVPFPVTDLASAIRAKVSVCPTLTATQIDDTIYQKYVEEIIWGAKARLFAMRDEKWYDLNDSMKYGSMFSAAIASHAIAAAKGRTRSAMRTRVVHGIE